MRGLRGAGPEIPLHVRGAQAGIRQALLGTDEVRKLNTVAQEEHRGVVTHDVVVALLGVELQRESAHVAHRIGEALLARDGGEAGQHRGHAPWLEQVRLGVLGDILGDGQFTKGTGALGVHVALRDALAVEVRVLFHQVHVGKQQRTLLAHGRGVLLGADRGTVHVRRRPGVGAYAAGGNVLCCGDWVVIGAVIIRSSHGYLQIPYSFGYVIHLARISAPAC